MLPAEDPHGIAHTHACARATSFKPARTPRRPPPSFVACKCQVAWPGAWGLAGHGPAPHRPRPPGVTVESWSASCSPARRSPPERRPRAPESPAPAKPDASAMREPNTRDSTYCCRPVQSSARARRRMVTESFFPRAQETRPYSDGPDRSRHSTWSTISYQTFPAQTLRFTQTSVFARASTTGVVCCVLNQLVGAASRTIHVAFAACRERSRRPSCLPARLIPRAPGSGAGGAPYSTREGRGGVASVALVRARQNAEPMEEMQRGDRS